MAVGAAAGIPFTGSEGGFLPPSLTGCALWLRADMGITSPDAGISRWLDKSASLAHVDQDTAANKPSRYSTVGNALDFDGTADTLEGAALAGVAGAHTIGMAFQLLSDNSGGAAARIPLSMGNPAGDGFELQISNATPALWRTFSWNAGSAIANWGSANTTPQTWVLRHDGAGGNADNQINGVDQGTLAQAQCAAPTLRTVLGGRTAASYSDCRWWAKIVYSDRKSNAIVANMTAYLTALRDGTALPAWRPTDETNLVLWLERPDLWAGPSVSAWANQGALGGSLVMAAAVSQPVLLPGASNGLPSVHFDDTTDRLEWSGAVGSFKFLHDGTGMTTAVVAALDGNGAVFDTCMDNPANVGFFSEYFSTARQRIQIADGTGVYNVSDIGAGGEWALNTHEACVYSTQTAVVPNYEVRIAGVVTDSGAFGAACSAANEAGALAINALSGGGQIAGGLIPELAFYDERVPTTSVLNLEAYLTARYAL